MSIIKSEFVLDITDCDKELCKEVTTLLGDVLLGQDSFHTIKLTTIEWYENNNNAIFPLLKYEMRKVCATEIIVLYWQ